MAPRRGLDLTGSSGSGRIDEAIVRGIPLQRLDLTLRGEGRQSPEPAAGAAKGPFLPQWIGADFQVRDVELELALAKVEWSLTRMERSVPVSGRLALEATARVPLGTLDDVKAYIVRGAADLAGASIGGLDLGRLKGRLDMKEGVLELADLRGRLVDRPEGHGRPGATDPPPAVGPLPPGGFRGRVRAELAADRKVHLDFEGVELADWRAHRPGLVPGPPALRPAHAPGFRGSARTGVVRPGGLDRIRPAPGFPTSPIRRPRSATSRLRSP